MEQDNVKYLIAMINNMDIKDKLRLAIKMSDSNYTNLKYASLKCMKNLIIN